MNPWLYLNDGKKLEVLAYETDKKGDIIVTHRHNNRIGHSIVRQTPKGESYFMTQHQRVYSTDLRRN